MTLLPMRPSTAGPQRGVKISDLIAHTLGHFVQPEEHWDALPVDVEVSAAQALSDLRRRFQFDAGAFFRAREARKATPIEAWWHDDARREAAIDVHDVGYAPMYRYLFRAAEKWRDAGGERRAAEVRCAKHVFVVVVADEADDVVMVTACESDRTSGWRAREEVPGLTVRPFAQLAGWKPGSKS